jgi:dihydroorotase
MNILIRQVKVIDPQAPLHHHITDIHIVSGRIEAIGTDLPTSENQDTIVVPGLCVSPGWVDPFAYFGDPGFEFKETLETGTAAAAAGGYTEVFSLPNTAPVVHNKLAVDYVVQKAKYLPVQVHPIGAVTKGAEGKELSEMYDMRVSGAVAFGDGTLPVQSSGLMLKALQYLKAIDGVLIQVPEDKTISAHGLMNESVVSTRLGLPGKPAIAEELMIQRDLELLRYTGSKIHFTGISTAKSVALIRAAKLEGLAVTCSVTPYHLIFTEEDLQEYDTNLKVSPPLRSAADRDALRQAVTDGTIDCIASHHQPHEWDSKVVEFEYARNGMVGLETAFAAVRTALPHLPLEQLAALFSTNVRTIFGLEPASVAVGALANLTFFLPDEPWLVAPVNMFSKSRNTAFGGMQLTGKPIGIFSRGQLILNKP